MSAPLSPPTSPKNNLLSNEDLFNYNVYNLMDTNKDMEDYHKYITSLIDKNDNNKNPQMISALISIPNAFLSERGYIARKKNLAVKLQHRGKTVNVNCKYVDIEEKDAKVTKELDNELSGTLLSTYDFSNLPTEMAELLANGCVLHEPTIEKRLSFMTNSNCVYSNKVRDTEQSSSAANQLTVLVDDLIGYWKNDYIVGWQVLARCFLIGFVMNSYNDKPTRKQQVSKNTKKSNKSEYIKSNTSKISRCTNIIMKCSDVLTEVNNVIDEMTKSVNKEEDSHVVLSKRNLNSNIKEKLRFSYLLFCFVNMFGYIGLISPATPDAKKFLNVLKLSKMEEMSNKFKFLSTTKLGKNLIDQNEKYGRRILDAIIKISTELKIINETMKNSLEHLIDNYMFRFRIFGNHNNIRNPAIVNSTAQQNFLFQQNYNNNKSNQLPQSLLYQANSPHLNQKNHAHSLNSFSLHQNSQNPQQLQNNHNYQYPFINQQQNLQSIEQNYQNRWDNLHNTSIGELKSNPNEHNQNYNQSTVSSIPIIQTFVDENSGLTYTVNTEPSPAQVSHIEEIVKFNAYDFKGQNQESKEIDENTKNEMILTIRNTEKGLNIGIIESIKENASINATQYSNYKEDSYLVSYYIALKEFVELHNMKIMKDDYRQNLIEEKAVFTNFDDNHQQNIYIQTFDSLITKYTDEPNDPMHYRSQVDNELIFFDMAKDLCLNNNEFYRTVNDEPMNDADENFIN